MKHIILCKLKSNSEAPRKALRLKHLEFMQEHKADIVAGGPALTESNVPWTMVLCTNFVEKKQADDFIRAEPYTASGQVFESVEIHPWSQVLPEPQPGSLATEIEKERAATDG